jgi:hypothetical protein
VAGCATFARDEEHEGTAPRAMRRTAHVPDHLIVHRHHAPRVLVVGICLLETTRRGSEIAVG